VQYKGGGYDGCFWEWNYFVFDSKGVFHDIGSSGRRGIKDRSKALELLNSVPKYVSEGFYQYRLTSKKSVYEFQNEVAATHVSNVVAKVNTIYGKNVMYWECDKCDSKQYDDDMHHDGYKGNGGIGVQMLGKLCSDCYCSGMCDHCGEYDDGDKVMVLVKYKDWENEEYCCKYCAETIKEKQSA